MTQPGRTTGGQVSVTDVALGVAEITLAGVGGGVVEQPCDEVVTCSVFVVPMVPPDDDTPRTW